MRLRLWIHLLLLLFAIATELVPSSHGQYLVAAPNGSPPVPRNVCQNATLNLIQSYGHNITRQKQVLYALNPIAC